MKNKSLDELMRIIGEDRANYSEDEVIEAEAELKTRSSGAEDELKDKIKTYGRIMAFLGAAMLFSAVMIIPFITGMSSERPAPDANASFIEKNFDKMFFAAGGLQLIGGGILFVGGLALRAFKDWGRKLIVFIIGVGLVYIVGFFIFWEITLLIMGGVSTHTIIMAIVGIFMSSLFFMVLLKPFKFFRSQRVKDVFSG